jgi:hypothetical protein
MGQAFFVVMFSFKSIPKKFQPCNVDQKRILRIIFFCLYVDNSTCYVGFNSTMRRHWMTFLVEKCSIGHFCITDIFLCSFPISCEIKSHCNIMIYDKKDVFQSFYLFFHYQIRYFSYAWISILNVKTDLIHTLDNFNWRL